MPEINGTIGETSDGLDNARNVVEQYTVFSHPGRISFLELDM